MSAAMKRHGIAKQVTAALLVKRARELANEALDDHVAEDVYVVSYHGNILHVACRHPAAVRAAQVISTPLKQELEIDFPRVTIKTISCRVQPSAFNREL